MRKHLKIIKKTSLYRQMVILDILEKKNMKKCMCIFIKNKRAYYSFTPILRWDLAAILYLLMVSSSSFPG